MEPGMQEWMQREVAALMRGQDSAYMENLGPATVRAVAAVAADCGFRTVVTHAWPNYAAYNVTLHR